MKTVMAPLRNELELRCQCSRLLFKKLNKTLEIKCPRCKEIHAFSLADLAAFLEAGNFCALHNLSSQAAGSPKASQSTKSNNG
ncbi:MAG: hypothetical protein Q8Q08_09630 [Candidatus Omnitrophota bacterium]|nr:hypothetical protein [Candidatus Omnitrophota bacterium]